MTCLLLPPLTINTLAFFMQFLKTVADNSAENKMSVENLAIIFTPGLMPFWDISSIRFKNHVKVIQILIENANNIGVLPDSVVDKILEGHEPLPGRSKSVDLLESGSAFVSKKKKRRSGSLTSNFCSKPFCINSNLSFIFRNVQWTQENCWKHWKRR